MQKYIFILFIFICNFTIAQSSKTAYNQTLADSLGSDEYGMKSYYLVILKTGKAKIENKSEVNRLFKEHLNNIGKLAKEGKLVVAGPLEKNENQYRGIFILNAKSKEDAQELLQSDAAIQADLLAFELYKWYGSAALPLYLQYHDQIQKTSF